MVVLLGPSREAISGVTTHLNGLLGSRLVARFDLVHFQVGSEGRREGFFGRLARLAASPFLLAATLVRTGAELLHINTSLNRRGEPIVMTPKDALAMFYGSGLEFIVLVDVLVTKRRA